MNIVTQEIIEEFKLRLKLDGNDEDENLSRIITNSINDLILKTGEYTIEESGVFKELVFERARYVYNDALEYFDTNFVSQITLLAIANPGLNNGGGDGEPSGPTIITYDDVVNALGYIPARTAELTSFITRYNEEQAVLNTRINSNTNRITAVEQINTQQNLRLTQLENNSGGSNVDLSGIETRLTDVESVNTTQNSRLDALENGSGGSQDLTQLENRVSTLETTNTTVNAGPRLSSLETSRIDQGNTLESNTRRIVALESSQGYNDAPILNRLGNVESVNTEQNTRLTELEARPVVDLTPVDNRITAVEQVNATQDSRLDALESQDDGVTFFNNDITLQELPDTFPQGITYSAVNGQTTNTLKTACIQALNESFNLSFVNGTTSFKFEIMTFSNSENNLTTQEIKVYRNTNLTDRNGNLLATLSRSNNSTSNTWLPWSGVRQVLNSNGDPNNRITGLSRQRLYDNGSNTIYINTSNSSTLGNLWTNETLQVRNNQNTVLRTEVVSSLPTSNLNTGRIVFNTEDNTFRGYNGGEWV